MTIRLALKPCGRAAHIARDRIVVRRGARSSRRISFRRCSHTRCNSPRVLCNPRDSCRTHLLARSRLPPRSTGSTSSRRRPRTSFDADRIEFAILDAAHEHGCRASSDPSRCRHGVLRISFARAATSVETRSRQIGLPSTSNGTSLAPPAQAMDCFCSTRLLCWLWVGLPLAMIYA